MCVCGGGGGGGVRVTASDVFRRACTRPTAMSAESRCGCFQVVVRSGVFDWSGS